MFILFSLAVSLENEYIEITSANRNDYPITIENNFYITNCFFKRLATSAFWSSLITFSGNEEKNLQITLTSFVDFYSTSKGGIISANEAKLKLNCSFICLDNIRSQEAAFLYYNNSASSYSANLEFISNTNSVSGSFNSCEFIYLHGNSQENSKIVHSNFSFVTTYPITGKPLYHFSDYNCELSYCTFEKNTAENNLLYFISTSGQQCSSTIYSCNIIGAQFQNVSIDNSLCSLISNNNHPLIIQNSIILDNTNWNSIFEDNAAITKIDNYIQGENTGEEDQPTTHILAFYATYFCLPVISYNSYITTLFLTPFTTPYKTPFITPYETPLKATTTIKNTTFGPANFRSIKSLYLRVW